MKISQLLEAILNIFYLLECLGMIENAFSKFFVAIYLMYISALYLFINSCFVTFFVAITRNCTAFYNQFQFLVRNLNPSAAKKSLCELIQYHHSVKEYVFSSS